MPSNDDMEQQNEKTAQGHASGDAPEASFFPNDHAVGADKTSTVNVSTDEASFAPLSSDNSMPQEFTFFQKKKRAVQAGLAPSASYASTAQVTAFATRLDSAMAVNTKTQRHIAELMTLMSEVARTVTTDIPKPTRKRLHRSKWLFYGCLLGFGVGWFLLFPSGHSLITQLKAFLAK